MESAPFCGLVSLPREGKEELFCAGTRHKGGKFAGMLGLIEREKIGTRHHNSVLSITMVVSRCNLQCTPEHEKHGVVGYIGHPGPWLQNSAFKAELHQAIGM